MVQEQVNRCSRVYIHSPMPLDTSPLGMLGAFIHGASNYCLSDHKAFPTASSTDNKSYSRFCMNNHEKPEILLSVIIPCYNCAPVIERCLDSIDFPHAEIIVVNDGSIDNSAEVVEIYIRTHPKNIRLINKKNGGVSSARNRGIDAAKGKYLCFVDADDYLCRDGLVRIVDIAEKECADVVLYRANYTNEEHLFPIISVNSIEIKQEMFTSGQEVLKRYDVADYYVWDAVYSRELVIQHKIYCKEDLHLHEDDVFKGEVYSVAGKVVSTDLRLYCYVQSSNHSSTHRQSIERQRLLINSGWKAASYRKQYILERCPEIYPLDRLKYMRWVCTPMQAKEAQLSLDEYNAVLNEFRILGVYPLEYKWIYVAHWYASRWKKFKYAIKTFLCNHPRLAYTILS